MGSAKPLQIGPEQAALLLARPVSANVATRDAAHRPHLTRAVGFRLSADRRRVTVFLPAAASACVLDDLRANGQIAVVFSEPATDRTVQLKGSVRASSRWTPATRSTCAPTSRRLPTRSGELGFPRQVAQTVLHAPADDVVAVQFTPCEGLRPDARARCPASPSRRQGLMNEIAEPPTLDAIRARVPGGRDPERRRHLRRRRHAERRLSVAGGIRRRRPPGAVVPVLPTRRGATSSPTRTCSCS